eukprot:SAG31_NODE_6104_length_2170_cov_2.740705_1_plen_450_part_00
MWLVSLRQHGLHVTHKFELAEGATGTNVGRSASKSDVVVASHFKATSRRHLELRASPSGVVLKDHDALNGVFVNDVRVDRVVLTNGDRIVLGSTEVDAQAVPMNARLPAGTTVENTATFTFSAVRVGTAAASSPGARTAPAAGTAATSPSAASTTNHQEDCPSVMTTWQCPLCGNTSSSVLVSTAKRWTSVDRQCPKCPRVPNIAVSAPAAIGPSERERDEPPSKRQRDIASSAEGDDCSNNDDGVNNGSMGAGVDASKAVLSMTGSNRSSPTGTASIPSLHIATAPTWAEDAPRAGTALWWPVTITKKSVLQGKTCPGCGAVGMCASRLTKAAYKEFLDRAEPAINRRVSTGHGCFSAAMLTVEALRVLQIHQHCPTAAIGHLRSDQYRVPDWLQQFEGWNSCAFVSHSLRLLLLYLVPRVRVVGFCCQHRGCRNRQALGCGREDCLL